MTLFRYTLTLMLFFSAIVYIHSTFDGCLSLIQVWNSVLTQAQMSTVITARNRDVTPSWYLAGLIWDYGYGQYHSGDGVTLVSPTARGLRMCPTGQRSVINTNGQNVCVGAGETLLIIFTVIHTLDDSCFSSDKCNNIMYWCIRVRTFIDFNEASLRTVSAR
jgi:hypothetical protein